MLVATTQPARSQWKTSYSPKPQRLPFYIHPNVKPSQDPLRGRLLQASGPVRAGTVLLVDIPYAIVPTVDLTGDDSLICSNILCSRRMPQHGSGLRCAENCIRDVIWCNISCRVADEARHRYECRWLKQNGSLIRSQERQYDFATLWHVVRLLAGWDSEMRDQAQPIHPAPRKDGFEENWASVESCCDYLESWPRSQLEHWERLIEKYMHASSGLSWLPGPAKLLSLLCKEETNTFGLYPTATGPLEFHNQAIPRKGCFGFGLYPRAAMFNHSCQPNVTHQPDGLCRMVYTAARDIAKGEECMITYVDLTIHQDVASRKELLQDLFRFTCTCERCIREEEEENMRRMDSLPFCAMD